MTAAGAVAIAPALGLTEDQVQARRSNGEVNTYRPPASRTLRTIVRANVVTRFNALLGSLFVVILVVGPIQDSLFGLALVANTAVGIFQELKAKRTLDRLSIVAAPHARVVRAGREQVIAAADVVRDDVLLLASGDSVPVDAEVLASSGLRLDESLLTGESHPAARAVGEAVMSGSVVVAGSGRCRVTAVGEHSYAARITSVARQFALARSELRDAINRILQVITWVIIPTAGLLIWSQLTSAHDLAAAVRGSVAGTVTMVPEGLVLLTSVAFAVGAARLARSGVLTRELPAVEGLARVDVLCIDKTGTLTTGRLRVTDLRLVSGAKELALAALAAVSRLEDRPNPTMRALAAAFPDPGGWRPRDVVAFDSGRKWSGADFGDHGCWVLGAPDILAHGDSALLADVERTAESGARVLMLGRAPALPVADVSAVVPMALVTLLDEIRDDAEAALRFLGEQGVDVKVLSGDHPGTVAALARRVGLHCDRAIDARHLGADAASVRAASRASVIGRLSPEQKVDLVRALQSSGHVVAMTGDGVNDVLAVKQADVGIAMGSGSPATRAVAQLVLLRDSFTAVPQIIAEGRRVIANVERVANLFVTKTVYATALAIAVGLAKLPFPFLPRHLTLVSTLTIGVPAFVLALAPNTRRAGVHFLSRVIRFAVPTGCVAASATYLAYTMAREDAVSSLAVARTCATIVLLSVGLWVLAILVRLGEDSQRWIVAAMAIPFLVVLALPPTRAFFALSLPRPLVLFAGIGVAAVSGLALECGWLVAGWLRPRRRPTWMGEVDEHER